MTDILLVWIITMRSVRLPSKHICLTMCGIHTCRQCFCSLLRSCSLSILLTWVKLFKLCHLFNLDCLKHDYNNLLRIATSGVERVNVTTIIRSICTWQRIWVKYVHKTCLCHECYKCRYAIKESWIAQFILILTVNRVVILLPLGFDKLHVNCRKTKY